MGELKLRKQRKTIALLLVCMLMLSVLAGCGNSAKQPNPVEPSNNTNNPPVSQPGENAKTRTVVDFGGATVEIPTNVTSICATFPAIDAIVVMLGGSDKIVATTASNATNSWFIRMVPEIVNLPQPFADLAAGNVEEIMNINPDVIVATGNNVQTLRNAGLTVVEVGTSTIDQLKFYIKLVGEVLGGDSVKKADQLLEYYNKNIELVTARNDAIAKEDRPTVFYAANGVLNTEGENTIVKEWIELSGGVNIAAENGVDGGFKDITQEQLLEWDPDFIICRDAKHKDAYLADPTLSKLSAIKNGNIYVNPKSVFIWCVRSADEAIQPLWASTIFQPELFKDIDMVEETRKFHKDFYGLDLTDEEIQSILFPTEG